MMRQQLFCFTAVIFQKKLIVIFFFVYSCHNDSHQEAWQWASSHKKPEAYWPQWATTNVYESVEDPASHRREPPALSEEVCQGKTDESICCWGEHLKISSSVFYNLYLRELPWKSFLAIVQKLSLLVFNTSQNSNWAFMQWSNRTHYDWAQYWPITSLKLSADFHSTVVSLKLYQSMIVWM